MSPSRKIMNAYGILLKPECVVRRKRKANSANIRLSEEDGVMIPSGCRSVDPAEMKV